MRSSASQPKGTDSKPTNPADGELEVAAQQEIDSFKEVGDITEVKSYAFVAVNESQESESDSVADREEQIVARIDRFFSQEPFARSIRQLVFQKIERMYFMPEYSEAALEHLGRVPSSNATVVCKLPRAAFMSTIIGARMFVTAVALSLQVVKGTRSLLKKQRRQCIMIIQDIPKED